MNIVEDVNRLVSYGLKTGLISDDDVIYVRNRIFEVLEIENFSEDDVRKMNFMPDVDVENLESILKKLLDYAVESNLIEDRISCRDLFDAKLMGTLVARPSEVRKTFWEKYEKSPEEATSWYYGFSSDTDYIRRYRIKKDLKWKSSSEYGDLDITINLSKPEKDPRDIADALKSKSVSYPSCLLCRENEGYSGRIGPAARQNHRIIPIELDGKKWFMQYSPYVYYNEHCIVFEDEHVPMKISGSTFRSLLDFVELFPHYVLGSNADLPIVGGSILTHNHFQGGRYEFPMAKAPAEKYFSIAGFEDVSVAIVKWPMSVLRLCSENKERISSLAERILDAWRAYSDPSVGIFSETDGIPHNTVTPIARKRNGKFELDVVLRNNITTKEHPLGLFHPHEELNHIKKENIGLIEVMGLAVLPSRLKGELSLMKEKVLSGEDFSMDDDIGKHHAWFSEFSQKYSEINSLNIDSIFQNEVAVVFMNVLSDCGVFKRTSCGLKAFENFISSI